MSVRSGGRKAFRRQAGPMKRLSPERANGPDRWQTRRCRSGGFAGKQGPRNIRDPFRRPHRYLLRHSLIGYGICLCRQKNHEDLKCSIACGFSSSRPMPRPHLDYRTSTFTAAGFMPAPPALIVMVPGFLEALMIARQRPSNVLRVLLWKLSTDLGWPLPKPISSPAP